MVQFLPIQQTKTECIRTRSHVNPNT